MDDILASNVKKSKESEHITKQGHHVYHLNNDECCAFLCDGKDLDPNCTVEQLNISKKDKILLALKFVGGWDALRTT